MAPVPFPSDATPNLKGYAAEYLVKYQLLRRGLGFLEPRAQSEALDLVVIGPSGKYHRCEIKAYDQSKKGANLYSTGSQRQAVLYSDSDRIDFFIVVNLAEELIAVLPYPEFRGVYQAILTPRSIAWPYVGRFDLFT